ncbi:MAG: serine/threonine-protein kinase [Pseudomonadota bacterium]
MTRTVYADRYEIVEEVGQGGMATVFRARDRRLDRFVALKVMHPFLTGNERNRRRFHQEAQVVANLKHDNIVQVHDYSGLDSREAFIVSEFVDGQTLKQWLETAPGELLTEVAALILHPLAGALGYAHDRDVIHRDVKPENAMVRKDGIIKLMDFGIAQVLNTEQMTTTGTMVGSPAFMSPEHIEGGNLDRRADIFSLGTIAYLLACGELPFQGDNPHALLRNILEVRYAPPERLNPAIGPGFARVIRTCLQRDPADRYATCHELIADLDRIIAAAEMSTPEEELSRYFQAPAAYTAALRERLVEREIREGRREAAAGHLPAAMRRLDRALALDESRKDVLELVGRLRRRQLWRQRRRQLVGWVGGGLAAGLVLGALVWTGLEILRDPETGPPLAAGAAGNGDLIDPLRTNAPGAHPDSSRGPAIVDVSEPEPIAEPVPTKADDPLLLASAGDRGLPRFEYDAHLKHLEAAVGAQMDRVVTGARIARVLQAGRLPAPGEPEVAGIGPDGVRKDPVAAYQEIRRVAPIRSDLLKKRDPSGEKADGGPEAAMVAKEVTIMVTPPATEIWVNEIKRGSGKVSGLTLPVGIHRLRLHHPSCDACADVERPLEIRADLPGPVIKEKIRFKPAVLLVMSERAGQVFVDDKPSGRVGRPIRLSMDTHRPKSVEVKVLFDDEYDTFDGQAELRAGQRALLEIP